MHFELLKHQEPRKNNLIDISEDATSQMKNI